MADQIIVGVDDHSVEAQDRPATQAATLRLGIIAPATAELAVGVRIGLGCEGGSIHGGDLRFFGDHDWISLGGQCQTLYISGVHVCLCGVCVRQQPPVSSRGLFLFQAARRGRDATRARIEASVISVRRPSFSASSFFSAISA